VPNTFIFKNYSTGDPNIYLWKFSDGTSFATRNVIHNFQFPGLHEACLVISREEHGETVCSDSLCKTIATKKYFNMGGHLFIGDYPINNPVSTGDTGVAYLFRVEGAKLIPYDTSSFTNLGYFTFPQILNGSYTVKATLTPGSLHYNSYFPGYYQHALTWREAQSLDLSDSSAYISDIHLSPANEALSGPAAISGKVVKAISKEVNEEMPYTEVILFDEQLNPLTFTMSGESGQFNLNNLPYGAYQLYVESPGKYSRMTAVWLDSSTPLADSIRLEVFDHDVTAIPDLTSLSVVSGDLFPNPATTQVSLNLKLVKATALKFEIKTLTGLTAWSESVNCNAGSSLVVIPVGAIRAGLYVFIVGTPEGSQIAVKKLLKY
jgi:PKD repeat protein